MNYEKLFRPEELTFYLKVIDESSLADLYVQLMSDYPQAAIRMVRGNKSKTVADFFNEIGAALQFPYYFGENWDGFDECITDLSWIDGEAYLLVVSQANLLLQGSAQKDFQILIQVLSDAHDTWLTQPQLVNSQEQPTAFHVLFTCSDGELAAFSQRLAEINVEFQIL